MGAGHNPFCVMATVPTVKVVKEDSDRGYMIIAEEDFDPDVHTKYGEKESEGASLPSDDALPDNLDYSYASNGFWSITEDGEKVESGRGKEALASALRTHVE